MKRIFLIVSIISIFSCEQSIDDKNGESIGFHINDFEITSQGKERKIDSLIRNNVNELLFERGSSLIDNYWFLCDTANIESLREGFEVEHKDENIQIHIGKESVSVRPIPGSYEIEKGPFAKYKIGIDSLGNIHSYVIDIQLNKDFTVVDYSATVRFYKTIDGVKKVTHQKHITKNEHYLLTERITRKK